MNKTAAAATTKKNLLFHWNNDKWPDKWVLLKNWLQQICLLTNDGEEKEHSGEKMDRGRDIFGPTIKTHKSLFIPFSFKLFEKLILKYLIRVGYCARNNMQKGAFCDVLS